MSLDWDELKSRFLRVESVGQRQLRVVEQAKRDEEERAAQAREDRLASWSADNICLEDFIPLVERRIQDLEAERGKILSDHPKLCDTLGRESELKAWLAQFREWAAKA